MNEFDKLVEHYYDILLDNNRRYLSHLNTVKRSKFKIHEALYEIVEQKLDYLLTPSILEYIIHYGGRPLKCLRTISKDDYSRIKFFANYFSKVRYEYQCHNKYMYEYLIKVSEKLQEIINDYNQYMDEFNQTQTDLWTYRIITGISYIVFAYCVINKREDDIHKLIDIFKNDSKRIIEIIRLNGIYVDDYFYEYKPNDILIDFVISRIEKRNVKVIK